MFCLQDKSQNSSNLKIPALTFLRTALESTAPSMWQQHLPVRAPAVFATVGERYYKVTAQGLRVAEQLIYVIRPQAQAPLSQSAMVSLLSCSLLHCLVPGHLFRGSLLCFVGPSLLLCLLLCASAVFPLRVSLRSLSTGMFCPCVTSGACYCMSGRADVAPCAYNHASSTRPGQAACRPVLAATLDSCPLHVLSITSIVKQQSRHSRSLFAAAACSISAFQHCTAPSSAMCVSLAGCGELAVQERNGAPGGSRPGPRS